MTFKSKKIVTGIETKISKKTGNTYIMINYLNEGGTTFSSMVDSNLKINSDIKQLSTVEVEFEVIFYNGSITGLKTISIQKVA